MLTFEDLKEMDDIAEDGIYCVGCEKLDLGYNLHALSDYARKHNLYPITQEVVDQARKDGVI